MLRSGMARFCTVDVIRALAGLGAASLAIASYAVLLLLLGGIE